MSDLPVPRHSIEDMERMAEAVVKSGLFQVKTTQAAMTLMLLCQAEGIHPMMAVRRYNIIQNQPAMKSDTMLAEFQGRGGKVEWLRMDEDECRARFHAPGLVVPVEISFNTEDAKRAGLNMKDNWQKWPRQMRRARVISEGVRASMPAVNQGIYSPEEVADFEPVVYPKATAETVAAKVERNKDPLSYVKEVTPEEATALAEPPPDQEPPALFQEHEPEAKQRFQKILDDFKKSGIDAEAEQIPDNCECGSQIVRESGRSGDFYTCAASFSAFKEKRKMADGIRHYWRRA